MESFKKRCIKYTLLIIATTAICMMLCFMFKCNPQTTYVETTPNVVSINDTNNMHNIVTNVISQDSLDMLAEQKFTEMLNAESDSLQNILIPVVKEYIDKTAPGNKVNCKLLVNLCFEHQVDVVFVIAHAQLESNFGTKKSSLKSNSLFSVNNRTYNDVNDSIEPYLMLLRNDYMIHDGNYLAAENLLIRFENKHGQRYSPNPNYEKMLSKIYHELDEKFYYYLLRLEDIHATRVVMDD